MGEFKYSEPFLRKLNKTENKCKLALGQLFMQVIDSTVLFVCSLSFCGSDFIYVIAK